jgi:hypothetical protein
MSAFWGDIFKEVLSCFKSRVWLILIRGWLWRGRKHGYHIGRTVLKELWEDENPKF